MAKPVIGYQNLLELSTSVITVTDYVAGFEKELAYNWRTYDGWKAQTTGAVRYTVDLGSAMDVDYWGAASHDLGTNLGSIKLQYSATGAFAGEETDFGVAISPTDDTTIMESATTAISARYWSWLITSTPASFFGVLSLGKSMDMVRAVRTGFPLPRESRKHKIMNSRSEGGAFLGRSIIRKGFMSDFNIELQTVDYARGTWHDFIDHAELKPFFFDWNPTYNDPVYAWMDGEPKPVTFDRNNTVMMGVKLQGLI